MAYDLSGKKLPKEELAKLYEMLVAKNRVKCEESYYFFFRNAWDIMEPGVPFINNWHYKIICDELQKQIERMGRGEPKEYDIIINIPPRSGKSSLVSRAWPAWTWTRFPHIRFTLHSYSEELAVSDQSLKTRRLIQSPWYQERWADKFQLTSDQQVKSYFDNSASGYYIAAGIGGTDTGRGGNVNIIDDPLSAKQAESEAYRKTAIDWYQHTMPSRLNNQKTDIRVMVCQRLHEEDLVGWIKKNLPGQYRIFCFPSEITEDTTPEYRDRYIDGLLFPNMFDKTVCDYLRKNLGEYAYAGQYLQRPAPEEGGIFKREWWKFWDEKTIPEKFEEKIASWDCAFKGGDLNDDVVGQVWGRIGINKYLLDSVKGKLDFINTINAIKELKITHPDLSGIFIEDKANGSAIISALKNEIEGIIAVPADKSVGGKKARAWPVSRQCQAGNIYLPSKHIKPWVDEYINEFANFPFGAQDGQVDATSQAIERLSYLKRVITSYSNEHITIYNNASGSPYTVLVQSKSGVLQGLVMFWDGMQRKLWVVDEINGMKDIGKATGYVIGNDVIFGPGAENTAFMLRKYGVYARKNFRYDMAGSILELNQMFIRQGIYIIRGCRELDRQLKNWQIINNMPDNENSALCEALCIIVSKLKNDGAIVIEPIKLSKYENKRKTPHSAPPIKQIDRKDHKKIKLGSFG